MAGRGRNPRKLCDFLFIMQESILEVEEWRQLEGFDHEVSNMGRIRSMTRYVPRVMGYSGQLTLRKSRIHTPSLDRNGYRKVAISKNGKVFHFRLHRLVALAFHPNPNNYPEVNHIIPDKENNRADNLEWCTPEQNKKHADDHGLSPVQPHKKFTDDQVRQIREEHAQGGISLMKMARERGVDVRTIRYIIRRRYYKEVY